MTELPDQQWYATQVDWFRRQYYGSGHEETSLLQHNGWSGLTEQDHPGLPVLLDVIDHTGSIIDLGCGNGLLLRSLIERSPHRLVPFGVDFLPESIREAQKLVLPEFQDNFSATNIADFDFEERKYTYILICPAYLHPDSAVGFLSKCLEHISAPWGKLILYEYCDVEIISHYESLVSPSGEILRGQFVGDNTTRLMWFEPQQYCAAQV